MTKAERQGLEAALQSLASMISRTEKAKASFAPDSAQHSLLVNRQNGLNMAAGLISHELAGGGEMDVAAEELENAAAPIASLLHKSRKAQEKLQAGTWQHTMLTGNIQALTLASAYLQRALDACMNHPVPENPE